MLLGFLTQLRNVNLHIGTILFCCQLVLKQRAELIDLHFSLFLCESDLFEFFHIGENVKDQHRKTSEKNNSLMLSSRSLLRSTASFN